MRIRKNKYLMLVCLKYFSQGNLLIKGMKYWRMNNKYNYKRKISIIMVITIIKVKVHAMKIRLIQTHNYHLYMKNKASKSPKNH